jgi:hypothetical protein
MVSEGASMASRVVVASALILTLCAPACGHHFRYTANLSGAAEATPNNSPGIGHAVITVDLDLGTITVDTTFAGLSGTVTEAHIQGPTEVIGAGTADTATQIPTFDDFPSGVTAGEYEQKFDLALASTYNPAFITSSGGTISDAYNALVFALDDGKAYFNINTSAYPSGEIRGFLSYVPGDFNDNGVVDAADYVLWRNTLGDVGEGLHADANNDDIITGDDYTIWRENFGRAGLTSGAGSAIVSGTAIPEPSVVLFLATVCGALVTIRARV